MSRISDSAKWITPPTYAVGAGGLAASFALSLTEGNRYAPTRRILAIGLPVGLAAGALGAAAGRRAADADPGLALASCGGALGLGAAGAGAGVFEGLANSRGAAARVGVPLWRYIGSSVLKDAAFGAYGGGLLGFGAAVTVDELRHPHDTARQQDGHT